MTTAPNLEQRLHALQARILGMGRTGRSRGELHNHIQIQGKLPPEAIAAGRPSAPP